MSGENHTAANGGGILIGLVSVSDRASGGEYADAGIPALREWLGRAIASPWTAAEHLIPDDFAAIQNTLANLVKDGAALVLTTGGTGPAPRDITPEATLAVAGAREMPGFGEEMRRISRQFVPTAILSRQTAVVAEKTLIINLPGQPKAIGETLDGLFAAVPYCLELIGAGRIITNPEVVAAFRPKSAGK